MYLGKNITLIKKNPDVSWKHFVISCDEYNSSANGTKFSTVISDLYALLPICGFLGMLDHSWVRFSDKSAPAHHLD